MNVVKLVSVLCCGLAVLSGLAATSFVYEDRQPHLAITAGVGTGFAEAKLAEAIIASGVTEGPTPELDVRKINAGQARALSRAAYVDEALNITAIRNIALLADAEGERDLAGKLMSKARELSRRDLSVNTWYIRRFAEEENIEGLLATFDNALRTSNTAREMMLPQLVMTLRQEEMVAPLLRLLDEDPNWELQFWEQAHTSSEALPNIVSLRIARGRHGSSIPPGYDARIMEGLVRTGRFADARRLHQFLTPGPDSSDIVRNSSFNGVANDPPFGWELLYDADLTANLDPSAGTLSWTAYGSSEQVIARQLVQLPDGSLRLKVGRSTGSSSGGVLVRLKCAERPGSAIKSFSASDAQDRIFEEPEANCDFYWLEIALAAAESREPREGALDSVAITAAGTGAPAE